MQTWQDKILENLSVANEIASKLSDKTTDRLVEDVHNELMSGDYDEDRGFKDNEIIDCTYEKIAEIISMHYDGEVK